MWDFPCAHAFLCGIDDCERHTRGAPFFGSINAGTGHSSTAPLQRTSSTATTRSTLQRVYGTCTGQVSRAFPHGICVCKTSRKARGGGQVAVVPPNEAQVTFRLDVGDGQGSQDALLDFEGDGKAGHHRNPESGHHRLLDPLTALQHQRVLFSRCAPLSTSLTTWPEAEPASRKIQVSPARSAKVTAG